MKPMLKVNGALRALLKRIWVMVTLSGGLVAKRSAWRPQWPLWIIALVVFADGSQAQDAPQQLPAVTLTAGMHRISAEVARTPEQRAIGLMHRKSMPMHAGMLFVFDQAEPLCFWMKNTLIPLSIAFLQDDGTILNIEEMKPQTLDSHCALQPARYALEMNAGWFAKRGLKPGDRIGGEVFTPKATGPRGPRH